MFQNNKINLIISILAAIVIWAYVVVEINPDETRIVKNVPVKITNKDSLKDRGLTLLEGDNYTIDVSIKGPRSETSEVTADDIEATANVFGYPKGASKVKVLVTVPDEVSLESVKPSYIDIVVEDYVTASKPININFSGEFKKDTEPGFVSHTPEDMAVSGAQSQVESVTLVNGTVKSSDVKDSETTVDVKAVPVDKDGNEVLGVETSQDEISVTTTLCYLKTVPLEVPVKGEVSSDYEVTDLDVPDQVTIKGVKDQVDSINKLKSEPVNISNITETTEIPLKFNLPDKVELADRSKNISLKVEISGVAVKDFTFSSSKVKLLNIKEGYDAYVDQEPIQVAVYGSADVLESLKLSDLVFSVDMSDADYSKSIYYGTVEVKSDKTLDQINLTPSKVKIIINKIG